MGQPNDRCNKLLQDQKWRSLFEILHQCRWQTRRQLPKYITSLISELYLSLAEISPQMASLRVSAVGYCFLSLENWVSYLEWLRSELAVRTWLQLQVIVTTWSWSNFYLLYGRRAHLVFCSCPFKSEETKRGCFRPWQFNFLFFKSKRLVESSGNHHSCSRSAYIHLGGIYENQAAEGTHTWVSISLHRQRLKRLIWRYP